MLKTLTHMKPISLFLLTVISLLFASCSQDADAPTAANTSPQAVTQSLKASYESYLANPGSIDYTAPEIEQARKSLENQKKHTQSLSSSSGAAGPESFKGLTAHEILQRHVELGNISPEKAEIMKLALNDADLYSTQLRLGALLMAVKADTSLESHLRQDLVRFASISLAALSENQNARVDVDSCTEAAMFYADGWMNYACQAGCDESQESLYWTEGYLEYRFFNCD